MLNQIKKYISVSAVALALLMPVSTQAATEAEIEQLEKQLIQKESQLLEPELKLDKLVVERAKLDGMGGWFQGSKKKELDRQIAEAESSINRTYSEMKGLQKQVQDTVFAVAQTYEGKGQYLKAIEYYLKIENQDDRIRFRIATCYKQAQDYPSAIQWFLKLSRTDQNLLEVVDCYKLAGNLKDTFYWLFQILEPIDLNAAEVAALELIEKYDYPAKKIDYPNFDQRLSDVYLSKAVRE
ncbi:MAG TPA: hypothetical protein PKO06_21055, partial [Candidatus Ozemobacteraceae bacterium]|nr:hypothetical protein [Candidatus Ozemobacteraceae bacterium]